MAFRALLFSKNSETNAAIAEACKNADLRVAVCTDIFTAIEKGKTEAFSCVIADWIEQPEASFLLKRARESVQNKDTVAIAIVDRDPTAAELRDGQLDFLIHRPIVVQEADAVLAQALQKMQPLSADQLPHDDEAATSKAVESSSLPEVQPVEAPESSETLATESNDVVIENASAEDIVEPPSHRHAITFRDVCAAGLVLAAAFFLWRAQGTVLYLSRTPEGGFRVLRESAEALFYKNPAGTLAVGAAGNDAQQDAYFSRTASTAQTSSLGVVATESNLTDLIMPLPKAWDFPLPVPTVERHELPPIHVERAALPESMRSSPPIAPPVVVAVNPALMPVSTPQTQTAAQQFSEPVVLTEDTARALLLHTVNPVYPSEALAQKLHGPVVLQAFIGRDGSVQDLKIVRGNFVLSRAAIAAVKQWRFQSYMVSGHAAATQTVITINFSYPPG
jgi:TonB family protein